LYGTFVWAQGRLTAKIGGFRPGQSSPAAGGALAKLTANAALSPPEPK
jgi:hypothetical protein